MTAAQRPPCMDGGGVCWPGTCWCDRHGGGGTRAPEPATTTPSARPTEDVHVNGDLL